MAGRVAASFAANDAYARDFLVGQARGQGSAVAFVDLPGGFICCALLGWAAARR